MKSNTLTRKEYKGKIYVENIRTNSCRIRNMRRIWIRGSENNNFRSTKLHVVVQTYRVLSPSPPPLVCWEFMGGN